VEITFHIPVYNDDPGPLLKALKNQWIPGCTKNIFIWNDGSGSPYRSLLDKLKSQFEDIEFIRWEHHPVNLGRATTRQRILEHSDPTSWNVSIDSDMIPDKDFIDKLRRYLTNPSVIYQGQHYYQPDPPATEYLLHWKYGIRREIKTRDPISFFTGIFAWHGTLTPHLRFETALKNYGHEDTLFGLLLNEQMIQVRTIPVRALHTGLMNRNDFLNKQREAVQNLILLQTQYPDFANRLIRFARRVNKVPFLSSFISHPNLETWCIKNLHHPDPSLIYLDLLKLHEYIKSKI